MSDRRLIINFAIGADAAERAHELLIERLGEVADCAPAENKALESGRLAAVEKLKSIIAELETVGADLRALEQEARE